MQQMSADHHGGQASRGNNCCGTTWCRGKTACTGMQSVAASNAKQLSSAGTVPYGLVEWSSKAAWSDGQVGTTAE